MQSVNEARLECLRLAITMAAAKAIDARQVLAYAWEFLSWLDGDPAAKPLTRPDVDRVLFKMQQALQENAGVHRD